MSAEHPVRVSLFVTCLVDQIWPSVGTSTVEGAEVPSRAITLITGPSRTADI